jgi:hypothetical protein
MVLALSIGAVSQIVFWGAYYFLRNGCLCAFPGAPAYDAPDWACPVAALTPHPATWLLRGYGPMSLIPIDMVAWTIASYTLLWLVVHLRGRIRAA